MFQYYFYNNSITIEFMEKFTQTFFTGNFFLLKNDLINFFSKSNSLTRILIQNKCYKILSFHKIKKFTYNYYNSLNIEFT